MNPYDKAIENIQKGISGAFQRVSPPANIRLAVARFDRRMGDPEGSSEEWEAITRRYGEEGRDRYVDEMKRLKEEWGL
ncbi:MAG: hypothetical protein ACFFDE_08115 [Promethearchaeota archaeon]